MAIDKAKILKLADNYIAKQNYNKALDELLKVLKTSAGDVNLLNKIGDLYTKLGKDQNAIGYFLKVAESYQASGFNLKAIALYKKIIRIDERFMDARHRLVELYIQQGYNSETKGELRRMAEFYYNENLFARALACYEKMVELEPNNLDARIKITELLVREGKRDEAMGHFVAMGQELLDKNMVNEAKKMIGQGLKMVPDHPGLNLMLTRSLLAEGRTEDALEQLQEICTREPRNVQALQLLGQTYLSRNQFEDAKRVFLTVLSLGGDSGPLESVAQRLLGEGKLKDAFECLLPLGENFLGRGNHEEATRLFRSLLYADENFTPAQEMLVRIYRTTGQTANALLSLEKVIHQHMDNGDESLALARIQELLELDPNNTEWRDKYHELTEGIAGGDPEAEEIHVFDEQSIEPSLASEGTLDVDLGEDVEVNAGQDARLANHLTEAKVFIKYGIHDQALEHLEAAKEIDFLNVEVNTLLKTLYLQRNDLKKAVPCMVSLVNAALEENDFARAYACITELGRFNADVAGIHKNRVDLIASEAGLGPPPSQGPPSGSFDLDFGPPPRHEEHGGDLLFQAPAHDQDIVDYRELPKTQPVEDEDDAWSLDMPAATPVAPLPMFDSSRQAEDMVELYDPGQFVDSSGTFDLPNLADIANDSRFNLSLSELARRSGAHKEDMSDLLDLESTAQEPDDLFDDLPEPIPEPPAPRVSAAPVRDGVVKHAPLGGGSGGSLASELEEIDFFISVEAFDDARNLIEDARRQFGEHPLLMERQHELDSKTQGSEQMQALGSGVSLPLDELAQHDGSFFDLAAELSEDLFADEMSGEINDATSQEEIQSVEELFEEFRKGVDEQIDDEDHETHYDLGIAYKEMGLLDEAINEFRKASRDPNKFLECATMIGNCMIELGRAGQAIDHYLDNLLTPNLAYEQDLALRYELAQAYQSHGEPERALEYLRQIQESDPDYRDVADQIEALV